MSELKVILDTPHPKMKNACDGAIEVYLKSEADKVIAKKDAKILALDSEVFKQKHHAELFLDERNYAETQLRHYKSEADKLLADLEESHKMEVEQLLMEIVELKADYKEACDRLQTANLIKDEQKAKADMLLSCLKCLVVRDLIKDCPEKASAIEIIKEHSLW